MGRFSELWAEILGFYILCRNESLLASPKRPDRFCNLLGAVSLGTKRSGGKTGHLSLIRMCGAKALLPQMPSLSAQGGTYTYNRLHPDLKFAFQCVTSALSKPDVYLFQPEAVQSIYDVFRQS